MWPQPDLLSSLSPHPSSFSRAFPSHFFLSLARLPPSLAQLSLASTILFSVSSPDSLSLLCSLSLDLFFSPSRRNFWPRYNHRRRGFAGRHIPQKEAQRVLSWSRASIMKANSQRWQCVQRSWWGHMFTVVDCHPSTNFDDRIGCQQVHIDLLFKMVSFIPDESTQSSTYNFV